MTSAGIVHRRWTSAVLLGAGLVLAGCEDGQVPGFLQPKAEAEADTGFASVPTAIEGQERDVEAPDVFDVNEPGLWDGRPSLGGVWVAYPGVTDPQRVIIRNTENNKSVVGALFRRERDNPGPRLQVSSDAAAALEMLAGAPTKLSVIALRKEQIPQEVAPAETLTDAEAPLTDAAPAAQPLPRPAETAAASLPAADEIQSSAIDPVAVAGAAIDTAAGVTPEADQVAAAPAPAPQARPAGQLFAMTKPFVQVGIFSVQSNAEAAAQQLRANGIVPQVKDTTNSANKAIYRVVAGPAGTRADRRALIQQIRGLGFTDAYAVTD